MKIGIYNGKEETAGAFANAMSISQAYGIAKNDYETAIITHSTSNQTRMLPADYSDSERQNISEIKSTDPTEELAAFDWVIWNSYRLQDNAILQSIRKRGVRTTKSFPRFFGVSEKDNRQRVASRLGAFDFVAFALQSDALISKTLDVSANRAGYVPRGFIPHLLRSDKRGESLQICIDGPVRPNDIDPEVWKPESTLRELCEALRILKRKFPMIKLISSRVDLGIEGSKRLKSLSVRDFYAEFFWDSDLYIGPPFSMSRQGKSGFLEDGYLGVYENQLIEAQMCGAAVLGSKFSIAPELLSPFQSSSTIDFSEIDSIVATVEDVLEETLDLRTQIAIWAKEKHDSEKTMKVWLSQLQNCAS